MKVAMMQPTFMPWQGYFELIYYSDRFVYLDDFQFVARSFHQRNRLFVAKGKVDWYTIPVNKNKGLREVINKAKISSNHSWNKKTWKRLQQNYSRTEFYQPVSLMLKNWMESSYGTLGVFNISLIELICKMLNIERDCVLSSKMQCKNLRSSRILEILHYCEADTYYCAHGSFDYMVEDKVFPCHDIEVLFQNFEPQAYHQLNSSSEFIPFLSIIDALMNVGPEKTLEMVKTGTKRWLSWQDMLNTSTNIE